MSRARKKGKKSDVITAEEATQELNALQPKKISPKNYDQDYNLETQILDNKKLVSSNQEKQFSYLLGNSKHVPDPMKVMEELLEREWGDYFLFDEGECKSEAIFFPFCYISNQCTGKPSGAILDNNIKKEMERLLKNLKEHRPKDWLIREVSSFIASQPKSDDIFDSKAFENWKLNLKITYIIRDLTGANKIALPETISKNFIEDCIKRVSSHETLSEIKDFLEKLEKCKKHRNIKEIVNDKIDSLNIDDSNLNKLFNLEFSTLGKDVEKWFREQLDPLKDGILKEAVILCPTIFFNVEEKKHREMDCFIIFYKRKLIISIEMKRTIYTDSVFKQIDKNHRLFEEKLGNQFSSEWSFFPVVCAKFSDGINVKSKHFITMETKVDEWLQDVFEDFNEIPQNQKTSRDDLKKVLQILVYALHASNKFQNSQITSSNWVSYVTGAIENTATAENILFYSKEQFAIMNNRDHNKLIISAGFGTGKSTLLKEKAIQLKNHFCKGEEIVYILGERPRRDSHTLFYHRMKEELEVKHKIKVMELAAKDGKKPIDVIRERNTKGAFLDEYHLQNNDPFLKELSALVDFLWVVPSTNSLHVFHHEFPNFEKEYTVLRLETNFRNTKKMVADIKNRALENDYRYKEGIVMPLENSPDGREPTVVKTFKDGMQKAKKSNQEGTWGSILVIAKPSYNLSDDLHGFKWKWYSTDERKNDFSKNKSTDDSGDNPYTFLLKNEAVLVIDEPLSLGFEWPTVIVFEGMEADVVYHDINYFMRCQTHLIIVEKPKKADS
ncbi:uncharacterized protein [Clytia hemisphaerica]|uniref:Uncharacterized protein n=1 Tax=Clytia hemisphaerica TaxID=252671 RepID=A0A7M5WUK0_9CNID